MWNKTDRIKRNTIIGEVYEGGIGLVDIESKFTALKAMWIPRLLSIEHNIKYFFNSFCKDTKIDIEYLMKTNETVAKDYGIIHNFPVFYSTLYAIIYVKMIPKPKYLPFLPKLFYYNLFGQIKYSILKVRQSALKIGLKAEFYM